MASVEERVSYLEGKVEEHSRSFSDLRGLIVGLDVKIDRLEARFDQRIDRVEQRIDRVEQRIDRVEQRIDHLEQRIGTLDQKVDGVFHALDQKISRQFLWLAGFQLTTLLAIIGFLGRLTFP